MTAPLGPAEDPPSLISRTILRAVRGAAAHPWVVRGAGALSAGYCNVFLMHRFVEDSAESPGLPIGVLHRQLAWLRAHRYELTSLATLVSILREGRNIPARSVAFTVDDGYADFAELAAPVFAEFDCPVTVFLVTDFIDRTRWLWWDPIHFGLSRTTRRACTLAAGNGHHTFEWHDGASRIACGQRIADLLKWMPARERETGIGRLLADLEVDLPPVPTADCAAMSWEQVRHLSGSAFTFGPHTRTHPILSQETDETAAEEIAGSWRRLRSALPSALPVFAFPNGDAGAFGRREVRLVADLGLEASVSTEAYPVSARVHGRVAASSPPVLPRLGFETDLRRFMRVASGMSGLAGRWLHPGQPPQAPGLIQPEPAQPTPAEDLRDRVLDLITAGKAVWPETLVRVTGTDTPVDPVGILGSAADENWLWVADIKAQRRALDATGRAGHTTAALLNRFEHVEYMDPDPQWVSFAQHRFNGVDPERLRIRQGTLADLPSGTAAFDCIALRADTVSPDRHSETQLARCHGGLTEGGVLRVVPLPMGHVPRNDRTVYSVFRAAWGALLTHYRWRRALSRAGFRRATIYYMHPSASDPIYIFAARRLEVLAAEGLRHDRLTGGRWRAAAIRFGLHATWYRHYFILARR